MATRDEPDPIEWVRDRWVEQGLPEADRFAAAASVLRTHQVVAGALDRALRPLDLTRTTYLLLVTLVLSPEGSRRLSYLARYLMVHPTTVTQLVDQLALRGLVRRRPHATDRRSTLVVLTAAGRRLVTEATAAAAAAGFGVDGVSPATLRSLTASLRRVRRAAGDLPS